MSGPFLAAAAALKAGTRPFVVCSTVLIVTFGCFLWYSATVCLSHPLAPWASSSPHHHIVRLTGPVGNARVLPVLERDASPAPTDIAATTQTPTSAIARRRRPVMCPSFLWTSILPPTLFACNTSASQRALASDP